MQKIGLFLNGKLMNWYPFDPVFFIESARDCEEAIRETGVFHELRVYDDEPLTRTNR